MHLIIAALVALFYMLPQPALAEPTVRVAALKSGTLAWELDTIAHYGLAAKSGIAIETISTAGKPGADIMLLGGEVDLIVTDWIWVARQRADYGRDFTFIPFSRQVGGVIVAKASEAETLADLKGKKIGVAGGPHDKSWVLLQALAARRDRFDLAAESEPVFAAPPLLNEQMLSGDLDGLVTFWPFAAKLKAKGMREIERISGAAQTLGLDPDVPLLGYAFSESWARANPLAIQGFARASWDAKSILKTDDAAWERLRPIMAVADEGEFAALKTGFREGIPATQSVDELAAAALYAVLEKEGEGAPPKLPAGTFYKLE